MSSHITEMFILTSIYPNVFTINDLNENSPELQNNYKTRACKHIPHYCGINNFYQFKTTLAILPSEYFKYSKYRY
jgi:hypothetical protein